MLYASDLKWWTEYRQPKPDMGWPGWPSFDAVKVGFPGDVHGHHPEVLQVKMGASGRPLCLDGALAPGGNSAHAAANLAFCLGASEIYLLGVDCKAQGQRNHWHADHCGRSRNRLTNPNRSLYKVWISNWIRLHAELARYGVQLVNCSRDSALTIPRRKLEDVLSETTLDAA